MPTLPSFRLPLVVLQPAPCAQPRLGQSGVVEWFRFWMTPR